MHIEGVFSILVHWPGFYLHTSEGFYICTYHTREVLLEEGLAETEVDDLIAKGVVGQAEPKAKTVALP